MQNFIIGLFLTIIGIAALMLLPSKQTPAPMPWEVSIMQDGNSKVFDIHMGTTTYKQAQQILHQFGKTAVFAKQGESHTVEAYFNSINLGGLSAKLVLNLDVDQQVIKQLMNSALQARIQPSGAHRYKLVDSSKLIDAPITSITYIPSVKLDDEMIQYRFGQAGSIEQDEEDPLTKTWHYPNLGLSIRTNPDEKTVLLYQHPS